MTANEFVGKLQAIDARFRFIPGPNFVSGLYLKQPRHPDAAFNGLRWVGAVPSPRFFWQLPEKDFFDEKRQYHRGWKTILMKLCAEKIIPLSKASRMFGWQFLVPGKAGKLTPIPGWNEPTRLEKIEREWAVKAHGAWV